VYTSLVYKLLTISSTTCSFASCLRECQKYYKYTLQLGTIFAYYYEMLYTLSKPVVSAGARRAIYQYESFIRANDQQLSNI